VESNTTLIRPNGGVELNAIASVDMIFALVIYPWHTEYHYSLGFDDPLKNLLLAIFWLCFDEGSNRFEDFLSSLQEFALPWISSVKPIQHFFYVGIHFSLLLGIVVN